MSVIARPQIEYYYDNHDTPEDLMGYNELQGELVHYLLNLMEWLFDAEGWYIALDLNIFVTRNPREKPTAPDIAVYKGVVLEKEREDYLQSWHIDPPEAPPPAIVFEIASKKTWKKDLDDKPEIYARMGVGEYVYYDPRPRRPKRSPNLRVWRMVEGTAVELPVDERGWVWSQELESWLVPDGRCLRLYDRNGERRLTEAEAQCAEKETERAAKETERAAKDAERAAKEAERKLKERAWEALRRLGVDPESLE